MPTIEQLNLEPVAEQAARALVAAHPEVTFTSGRRTFQDQARAMSQNVAANNKWIYQTYRESPPSVALQDYVDHNLSKSAAHYQQAFAGILERFSPEDLTRLSKHLGGLAFDIQPIHGGNAEAIKNTVRNLPGLTLFLDKEGGLIRWHCQF